MADTDACMNTDREIWREREGDYYADSIHVTKMGGIGINCGGSVIVKSVRGWHGLAKRPQRYNIGTDELVEVTQEWVDDVHKLMQTFGRARHAARNAVGIRDGVVRTTHPALQEFLDAWKPELERVPQS